MHAGHVTVRVSFCSPRSRHGNIELTVPKRMEQRRVAEEEIVGRQPKQIGERDSTPWLPIRWLAYEA